MWNGIAKRTQKNSLNGVEGVGETTNYEECCCLTNVFVQNFLGNVPHKDVWSGALPFLKLD